MERIVVTGGAGFIGSHLVERLIAAGYAVTILDNMITACPENIHPQADFISGDVSREADIARLPRDNVRAVFHLAAQSSGEASFDDPFADFSTNVTGTFRMLEWCRQQGVSRFLFSSSMAAYGLSCETPLCEETACSPASFYGTAKLAAENYIRFYERFGLHTTILRLFNVYGSRQNLNNMKQGMASIYLSFLLKNEPIMIKGSLDRFRDQTHVSDVVDAMLCCLNNVTSFGKTYNIATGEKITVRNLLDTMLRVSGKPPTYPIVAAEGTTGDIFGCYADVSRAAAELGWRSRMTLAEGLAEMVAYFEGDRQHV